MLFANDEDILPLDIRDTVYQRSKEAIAADTSLVNISSRTTLRRRVARAKNRIWLIANNGGELLKSVAAVANKTLIMKTC